MSLENLEKAFQIIEEDFSQEEKDFGQGSSLREIEKAEQFLNSKFPLTYRKFLEKYGYGGVGSFEIYGLTGISDYECKEPPFRLGFDSVWITFQDHRDFNHPLHLLIIYNFGEGTKYCLDLSQMKENECPVVVWPIFGYENNPKLEIIAKDFGDFFLEMVQEELQMKQEEG